MRNHFFLLLLRFSLSFNRLIIMFPGVDIFKFNIFRVHWDSWMFRFMSFIRLGKFLAIISSNNPFVFVSSLGTPSINVDSLGGVLQVY